MSDKSPEESIAEMLDKYWELAHAEGREGRSHDTEAGDAQRARAALELKLQTRHTIQSLRSRLTIAHHEKEALKARVALLEEKVREGQAALRTLEEKIVEDGQVIDGYKDWLKEIDTRFCNGDRPLPWDRDALGRFAHEARERFLRGRVLPLPPWDELPEANKEQYRVMGEAVARWTVIAESASLSTYMDGTNGEASLEDRDEPGAIQARARASQEQRWEET